MREFLGTIDISWPKAGALRAQQFNRILEIVKGRDVEKLVNEVVLRLDAVTQQKRVVAPEQFIPILDRIAKNESILNMARERAASLSDTFKAMPK